MDYGQTSVICRTLRRLSGLHGANRELIARDKSVNNLVLACLINEFNCLTRAAECNIHNL